MSVARVAPASGIRRARPVDAEGIVALLGAVAAEGWLGIAAPHSAECERRALTSAPPQDYAVWVAEAAGRIAGHLLLARGERPYAGHTASVAVAVDLRCRGHGLGGALLEAGVAWARRSGVSKVCAGVFADNEAALGLFGSRGFEREGVRRAQFVIGGVARDEVVLARFLG